MKTIRTVAKPSVGIVAVVREKLRSASRNRHRESLLTELGLLCYKDRSGASTGDADADINRLVAKLLLLDEPWGDSDQTVVVPDGDGDRSRDVAGPKP